MLKCISSLAVLGLLATAPSARADSVSFSLTNPVQAGAPGTMLAYVATVATPSSNTGDVYLNGDTFSVSGALTLDDSGFLTDFPLYLAPGQSVTDLLFTIASSASGPEGVNTGTFELLGGPDGGSANDLGSVVFTAQVTPEPSSLVLLMTGAVGGWTQLRRRGGLRRRCEV